MPLGFSLNPFDFLKDAIGKYQDLVGAAQNAAQSHSALPSQNVQQTGTPIDNIIQGLQQIPSTEFGKLSGFDPSQLIQQILDAFNQGDYRAIQGYLAGLPSNVRIDPQWEKYIDNMIATQNTGEAQQFEIDSASNNLLRAGSQLESLGLSPSGVLQTGGSNTNGVGAANNTFTNLSQQMAMQRYSQRMAMAKQLLSMTSQMASAGIYGGAIGAARSASSMLTSAASHSAMSALNAKNDAIYAKLASQPGWKEYY